MNATASAGKQDTLRAWGVPEDHIASSRTLDFADAFRAVTGGRGVDVVLNSLAKEAIDASLGLLAPGGRFAEMGKTDIRDIARTEADHPGITYRAYNILGISPGRIGEVLSRDTLCKSVGSAVNERAIDVQVTRLRRKIEPDPSFPRFLRTVRGQGYRLVDA